MRCILFLTRKFVVRGTACEPAPTLFMTLSGTTDTDRPTSCSVTLCKTVPTRGYELTWYHFNCYISYIFTLSAAERSCEFGSFHVFFVLAESSRTHGSLMKLYEHSCNSNFYANFLEPYRKYLD